MNAQTIGIDPVIATDLNGGRYNNESPKTSTTNSRENGDPDLRTVGLTQLVNQAQKRISVYQIEKTTVTAQRAAVLTQFNDLSNVHDVPDDALRQREAFLRDLFPGAPVLPAYRTSAAFEFLFGG